ncbi:MAG: M15 family metallopeptidase, partial [Spirochaetota bacterium]
MPGGSRPTTARLLLATAVASGLFAGCGAGETIAPESDTRAPEPQRTVVPGEPIVRPAPVHPGFDLTQDEALALAEKLPEPAAQAARADLSGWLGALDILLDQPDHLTVLADKEHALPADYVPAGLVRLDDYADRLVLSRPGHRLTRETTTALIDMSDAATADGVTLVVSSTYRSYDYQADLFDRWVAELGLEEASRVSARPGTSQHQLGTTVDFGCICEAFAHEPAGVWLAENAWRYGFSLSYPRGYEEVTGYAYEPWHFRYVGPNAARI